MATPPGVKRYHPVLVFQKQKSGEYWRVWLAEEHSGKNVDLGRRTFPVLGSAYS